ncbi:unnamed protein product [Sphagnum troendelagicum]|uniref:F-box domain-containing protein n=1 Tax=Sphagnum troendelagicum TaxID=128251 RepID=A0ABP0TPM8_9BRYO
MTVVARGETGMKVLPVELIGSILSNLADARDVMRASATWRKWRMAARKNLLRLRFRRKDWNRVQKMSTEDLEDGITKTLMRMSSLQDLCIRYLGDKHEFSAAAVTAWLLHFCDSLRFLTFKTEIKPLALDIMGEIRHECLVLKHADIILIRDLDVKVRFPTLVSLTLWDIRVSAVDLHGLLLACPELEDLSLNRVFHICSSEARVPLELTSSSLKSFTWQNWTGNWTGPKLVAEKLESFHLKDNENPSHLHVVTKGNLQEVEKLLEGSSILEKVVVLELGCLTVNSLFDQWISGVVQRCPNLRYLVVHCGVSQLEYGMNTLQMLDKYLVVDFGREFNMFNYQWHPYQECLYVWELQEAVGVLALTPFCELNPTGDYIC